MCDESNFIKVDALGSDTIYKLGCPQCNHPDGLNLVETCKLERRIPDVTTQHIEYGDVVNDSYEEFREIGVCCTICEFRHIGDDWRSILVPIGVVK